MPDRAEVLELAAKLFAALGVEYYAEADRVGWRCPACTGRLTIDAATVDEVLERALSALADAVIPHRNHCPHPAGGAR